MAARGLNADDFQVIACGLAGVVVVLVVASSGGSHYTYEDDLCFRGSRHTAWRIVFH